MKKFALLIVSIMAINCVFAIEDNLPYKFDKQHMKFVPVTDIAKTSEYKSAEKLMQKAQTTTDTKKKIKYYEKILKKTPQFMPAIYNLMFLYAQKGQPQEVYNYAKQLRSLNSNHILPDDMITDMIARSCIQLNQLNEAANEFEKISDPVIANRNNILLANTYLKLNNYEKAVKYASRLPKSDYNSIEILYTANIKQGNKQTAYNYALKLIKLKPEAAENYLRAAYCIENNNKLKLDYLYKAKDFLLQNPDNTLYTVDKLIAELEQIKIDNAYKKITDFVVKPDWKRLYLENSPDINFYIENWSKPQDNFFQTANNCISKYSGTNLVKCFEALNVSEDKRIQEVKLNIRELQVRQREQEQELMMQKLLLLQQQMTNYNRYYYYHPFRYYRPYFYW